MDYFEEFCNDPSKKRVNALLSWWNQYVFTHSITCNSLSDPVIHPSSQVFPQHVASTTDSTESYDLLAAQQDEDCD